MIQGRADLVSKTSQDFLSIFILTMNDLFLCLPELIELITNISIREAMIMPAITAESELKVEF